MEIINKQYTIKINKINVAKILNNDSSELKECIRDESAV